MSLLEQLIRQLGNVELDPNGLVLVVDGQPVAVKRSISIAVAPAPSVAAPSPAPVQSAGEQGEDEDEEWAWTIALARARANPEPEPRPAVQRPPRLARGTAQPVRPDDDVTKKRTAVPPRRHARIAPRARTAQRAHVAPPLLPLLPPPLPPPPDE